MSKYLVIANWKMNPSTKKEASSLAHEIEQRIGGFYNTKIVIVPPFPFFDAVKSSIKKAALGAGNIFWEEKGPYTGEVSPLQIRDMGAEYVILGHSERREHLGETDEVINKKMQASLKAGLSAILCVGEREREGNDIPPIVGDQLAEGLRAVKKQFLKNVIIAYEPVWAISTNKGARPDTPDSAFRANLFIRKIITGLYGRKAANEVRVLYGGSVRRENILSFLTEGNMQGALVGGASLDPREFVEIAAIASRAEKK